MDALQSAFQQLEESGEGHCLFLAGEAGIGKTALTKAFYNKIKKRCTFYQGTCDALFTPRPLAPLYDILLQLDSRPPENNNATVDSGSLFAQVFQLLKNQNEISFLVFEDIHWADEATLDFIRFLGRRINQLNCLFILTYRDNEIRLNHPLLQVMGQLNPDSFTRLQLQPLSKSAVEKMAEEKGYKGEDVYSISGGNPFYVNEILASYSTGVPDNIRDSILSSYNRLDENTKHVWQIISVLPTGFEINYLEKMEPGYADSIHNCLAQKILVPKEGFIYFKHELFRRTIESSLSPLLRIDLNKRILGLFKQSFENKGEIERIVHHAKNASEPEVVVEYAPKAAKQAARLGAHVEASKLYLTAIEYYQGKERGMLLDLYEAYSYECYLTNQIKEAIIYATKSLKLLQEEGECEKSGECLRLLSRLWWFDGNRHKADQYALQSVDVLKDKPNSTAKAMAFSNMSLLKMLSDERQLCIFWGEEAIKIAMELNDSKTLAHALNNVGTVRMRHQSTRDKGLEQLNLSKEIALANADHENVARYYTNVGINAVKMKEYDFAKPIIEEGIKYCGERNLDSMLSYLIVCKAKLFVDLGNWNEALSIANKLTDKEDLPPVIRIVALAILATIKMRCSHEDVLPLLLEAKEKAYETIEPQRILPVLVALLEYEWITGKKIIETPALEEAIMMVKQTGNIYEDSEFAFWLWKARGQKINLAESYEGYLIDAKQDAKKAAVLWNNLGCPYEEALMLNEGNDADKIAGLEILYSLGAGVTAEKLKFQMRASGIKGIPRGIRKSTRENPANLTLRELGILRLLGEGMQNKEIAGKLFISPKTVDHHISSILFKLEVNSRTKAVKQAHEMGILK